MLIKQGGTAVAGPKRSGRHQRPETGSVVILLRNFLKGSAVSRVYLERVAYKMSKRLPEPCSSNEVKSVDRIHAT